MTTIELPEPERVGPGVYPGMAAEWYHSDPCVTPSLSSGVLRKLINGTPLHAFRAHPRFGGDDNPGTKRTEFGSAAHRYILGRGAEVEVLTFKDYRTNAAKDARTAAQVAGKIPLLLEDYNAVQRMVGPARVILDTIATGAAEAECVIVWEDVDGILCRAMLDAVWMDCGLCVDYKTCSDASADGFGRTLFNNDYELQRAFYQRGMRKLGLEPARFVFLAQEDETGICCLHEPDEHASELADGLVDIGIREWARCLKADDWPGYGQEVHRASMPGWKAQKIELRLMGA